MKRIIILFILVTVIFSEANSQRKLSFIEEYIDFTLNKDFFEVNGVYLFHNTSDELIRTTISFPFASNVQSIDTIRVFDLNKNNLIEYKSFGKSIYFPLEIAANDTVSYNIAYRQPIAKINEYILLTTHAWGKPLQKVKYSLKVNDGIEVEEISYAPDSITASGIRKWEKQNFMPDKNFIVTIKN